ncbi:MAG: glycoside hydrolase family 2 protein [Promethearchaeota archaeon]
MIVISLDGTWKAKPDLANKGDSEEWYKPSNYNEKDKSLLDINIPNSFNILEGYEIFEGIFWHFYCFDLIQSDIDDSYDYFLNFKGSNYITNVWLNGDYLGKFEGGFTPFNLRIKSRLKANRNFLAVRVDSTRRKGQIPDYTFDWLNWGGIYRGVELLILNKNRVQDVKIKTTLNSTTECIIEVLYKTIGETSIRWEILDTDHTTILFEGTENKNSGEGSFSLTFKNPKLWCPDTPHLYYLKIYSTLSKTSDDLIFESTFGIRQIEIRGIYIYLNKRRFYLKGICLHEEYLPYGRTIPYKQREQDIKNMKSLGINALRTAHYSHDEDLIEICDKLGMLILEEIPVYWFCSYKGPKTFKVAARQMRNLIKRDINHPSVIWWSVGNEVPIERRDCKIFFKRMMDWTRRFDDTRIVTFVSNKMICDLTKRYADVGAINAYFGWYYGSPKMIKSIVDIIHVPIFNKPLFYTEFGAGAKYGFHAEYKEQVKFSEEKQLYVLDYTIRTLNSIDYLAGWFIWSYRDFRSFLRENEFQQGFNRKGIVSGEKNEKKLIYYRIPKIINETRKLIHFKLFSVLIWALLFPFAYIITYLIDFLFEIGQKKRMDSGKKLDAKRILKEKSNKSP